MQDDLFKEQVMNNKEKLYLSPIENFLSKCICKNSRYNKENVRRNRRRNENENYQDVNSSNNNNNNNNEERYVFSGRVGEDGNNNDGNDGNDSDFESDSDSEGDSSSDSESDIDSDSESGSDSDSESDSDMDSSSFSDSDSDLESDIFTNMINDLGASFEMNNFTEAHDINVNEEYTHNEFYERFFNGGRNGRSSENINNFIPAGFIYSRNNSYIDYNLENTDALTSQEYIRASNHYWINYNIGNEQIEENVNAFITQENNMLENSPTIDDYMENEDIAEDNDELFIRSHVWITNSPTNDYVRSEDIAEDTDGFIIQSHVWITNSPTIDDYVESEDIAEDNDELLIQSHVWIANSPTIDDYVGSEDIPEDTNELLIHSHVLIEDSSRTNDDYVGREDIEENTDEFFEQGNDSVENAVIEEIGNEFITETSDFVDGHVEMHLHGENEHVEENTNQSIIQENSSERNENTEENATEFLAQEHILIENFPYINFNTGNEHATENANEEPISQENNSVRNPSHINYNEENERTLENANRFNARRNILILNCSNMNLNYLQDRVRYYIQYRQSENIAESQNIVRRLRFYNSRGTANIFIIPTPEEGWTNMYINRHPADMMAFLNYIYQNLEFLQRDSNENVVAVPFNYLFGDRNSLFILYNNFISIYTPELQNRTREFYNRLYGHRYSQEETITQNVLSHTAYNRYDTDREFRHILSSERASNEQEMVRMAETDMERVAVNRTRAVRVRQRRLRNRNFRQRYFLRLYRELEIQEVILRYERSRYIERDYIFSFLRGNYQNDYEENFWIATINEINAYEREMGEENNVTLSIEDITEQNIEYNRYLTVINRRQLTIEMNENYLERIREYVSEGFDRILRSDRETNVRSNPTVSEHLHLIRNIERLLEMDSSSSFVSSNGNRERDGEGIIIQDEVEIEAPYRRRNIRENIRQDRRLYIEFNENEFTNEDSRQNRTQIVERYVEQDVIGIAEENEEQNEQTENSSNTRENTEHNTETMGTDYNLIRMFLSENDINAMSLQRIQLMEHALNNIQRHLITWPIWEHFRDGPLPLAFEFVLLALCDVFEATRQGVQRRTVMYYPYGIIVYPLIYIRNMYMAPLYFIHRREVLTIERSRALGTCPICAMEYVENDVVGGVTDDQRCTHVFHVGCIECWLRISSTCPMCRFQVRNNYE